MARAAMESAQSPEQGDRLQCAPGEQALWVRGDPARLCQVLINLLSNLGSGVVGMSADAGALSWMTRRRNRR